MGILFGFNLIFLAQKAELVAKVVMLSISPLTSFILALKAAVGAKLVIIVILSSISLILALYASFSTAFYCLYHLIFFKSTGTGFNLSASNSSASNFKLARTLFYQIASTHFAFFKSDFVA